MFLIRLRSNYYRRRLTLKTNSVCYGTLSDRKWPFIFYFHCTIYPHLEAFCNIFCCSFRLMNYLYCTNLLTTWRIPLHKVFVTVSFPWNLEPAIWGIGRQLKARHNMPKQYNTTGTIKWEQFQSVCYVVRGHLRFIFAQCFGRKKINEVHSLLT